MQEKIVGFLQFQRLSRLLGVCIQSIVQGANCLLHLHAIHTVTKFFGVQLPRILFRHHFLLIAAMLLQEGIPHIVQSHPFFLLSFPSPSPHLADLLRQRGSIHCVFLDRAICIHNYCEQHIEHDHDNDEHEDPEPYGSIDTTYLFQCAIIPVTKHQAEACVQRSPECREFLQVLAKQQHGIQAQAREDRYEDEKKMQQILKAK
mmetsp:Transcript_79616/g.145672  ORF Transcript_79616/g.145672 Transcript_79616/m.145672 type:complete len:203 (+) Transcript_79616:598-1206(+)